MPRRASPSTWSRPGRLPLAFHQLEPARCTADDQDSSVDSGRALRHARGNRATQWRNVPGSACGVHHGAVAVRLRRRVGRAGRIAFDPVCVQDQCDADFENTLITRTPATINPMPMRAGTSSDCLNTTHPSRRSARCQPRTRSRRKCLHRDRPGGRRQEIERHAISDDDDRRRQRSGESFRRFERCRCDHFADDGDPEEAMHAIEDSPLWCVRCCRLFLP